MWNVALREEENSLGFYVANSEENLIMQLRQSIQKILYRVENLKNR